MTAKVNLEIEFLMSLPEDEAARRKIIKKREAARSAKRAAINPKARKMFPLRAEQRTTKEDSLRNT